MRYIVGIDEAGRGPLAGPVAVGVVLIPKTIRLRNPKTKLPLRDSKKLPEEAREAWFEYIQKHPKIFYKVVMVRPKTIDGMNITEAVNLAATRALGKLIADNAMTSNSRIYLDAGIKINKTILVAGGYTLVAKSLVRGDEKINAVKLASIAAKVTRDTYMKRKHKEYPEYKFHIHKGYGTKTHIQAIKKFGPCVLHRLTFIKKCVTI